MQKSLFSVISSKVIAIFIVKDNTSHVCQNCGAQLDNSFDFCGICGNKVDKKDKLNITTIIIASLIVIGLLSVLIVTGFIFLIKPDITETPIIDSPIFDPPSVIQPGGLVPTTDTPTVSMTPSMTPSITVTPTASYTSSQTSSPTMTYTASITSSYTPTRSVTPSNTPTPTKSYTPTFTPSPTRTTMKSVTPVNNPIPPAPPVPPVPIKNELVLIPEGEFLMGSLPTDPYSPWGGEFPQHKVFLSAFYIHRYEVTNGMYKKCLNEGACSLPSNMSSATVANYFDSPDYVNYPVIFVNWSQAKAYCEWEGGRLPTEAEWEKAARGSADIRVFPWGNSADCSLSNYQNCVGDTKAVGSYPDGRSPYGLYDMAGNVVEWAMDWMGDNYYQNSPYENPTGPENGTNRTLRGGAWNYNDVRDIRSVSRGATNPQTSNSQTGFRCVVIP